MLHFNTTFFSKYQILSSRCVKPVTKAVMPLQSSSCSVTSALQLKTFCSLSHWASKEELFSETQLALA